MALRIMFAADWHLIAGGRDDVKGRGTILAGSGHSMEVLRRLSLMPE